MNRFVIAEPKRCIGCNTCMAACAMVHRAAGLQDHPRLTVTRQARGTAPILCRQCEDAPCARVCPVNAIKHENDAIVLNENQCIGCKLCAIVCPFGAITPDGSKPVAKAISHLPAAAPATQSAALSPLLAWTPGVRSVAVKCDLCAFSANGPECVRVCPTRAMFVVDNASLADGAAAKRRAAAAGIGPNLPPLLPPEKS